MSKPENNLTLKQSAALALKGVCMGIADVIPGISGGTIAFILGIYEEFIYSIRSFDAKFLKYIFQFKFQDAFGHVSWQFLGSVVFGIAAAILACSHAISYLFEHYPIFVNAFFFGLILATAPIIALIIQKWTYGKILGAFAAGVITFFLVALTPLQTPDAAWFVFLSGFIAISAMILPGISGSFILVLLGKYHFVLLAIKNYDLMTLAIFGAGVVSGVVSFVRVLGWLLHKRRDMTVAVLTGIVIGSLNKIWPWKETLEVIYTSHGKMVPVKQINALPAELTGEVLLAIFFMGTGFLLTLVLNFSGKRKKLNF